MRTPALASFSLATLLVLTSARDAHATEDDASAGEEPAAAVAGSYAWQTLLVDGGALATMILGVARDERAITSIGLGAYAFGPPAVHAAHGRFGRAGIDLASRVVLPIGGGAAGVGIGVLVGAVATGGVEDTGSLFAMGLLGVAGGVLGIAGGYVAAVAIDAGVLAAPDKPDQTRARVGTRAASGPRVLPTFGADARGATAGIAGVF